MIFRDLLYGEITLPDWIDPFLRLPEFVRLRGVRLSNIDSLQYKDFGSATRYDHAIGVVYLALRVAELRRLNKTDTVHLALAALLHDAGTPPFAHTLEIVFDDVDHELDIWNALGIDVENHSAGFNAYEGELPRFIDRCKSTSKLLGITISPETIVQTIDGQGDFGFLIKGSIDLDNIDNVIRGSYYMGLQTSGALAESIVDWISAQEKSPTLEGAIPTNVQEWINLRDEYYRLFFDSSDEEKGRQALLQFILRESSRLGFPKERMLKTTDEGLISSIQDFASNYLDCKDSEILLDAVLKFRRLEHIPKITEIPFEANESLDALRVKSAIEWIELKLRQPGFVPMLFFSRKRFSDRLHPKNSLFSYPKGFLSVFALYEPKSPAYRKSGGLRAPSTNEIHNSIFSYLDKRPWNEPSAKTKQDLRQSLDVWGNWSFIGSRNDCLHAYPSTFVHSIPSAFIKSLRLSGDLIIDPFCGSGITLIEGIKSGCRVICSDINEIALLISRVRTTYLSIEQRSRLRDTKYFNINELIPAEPPKLDNLFKWHHPNTVEQLAKILTYIQLSATDAERDFLKLCFSSILTSTTARRGKQHGWFADNTPLRKGETAPPFIDAYNLFINKVERNLNLIDGFYSELSRSGESIPNAFARASVLRANASQLTPSLLGIENNTIGGIITSPPYLAMSDYSLGQRLSYAWLFPGYMERDFNEEIGARRRRFNPNKSLEEYINSLTQFAQFCRFGVRPGGFVALVMGASESVRFRELDLMGVIDSALLNNGFDFLWEKWRPINWHRNHGYERLKTERLTVFVKQ